jgi:hypothetical protein
MENDRIQAGVRKDVDAIAAATADDYVMIDFEGKVRNKAATLERIKSSEIQLQSNSLDELDVRFTAIRLSSLDAPHRRAPSAARTSAAPSALRVCM